MGRGDLREYARRRRFERSGEPSGGSGSAGRFVVQRHSARRLHYDLRLELDGVLKSWAVPKGPSYDPGERRLAVHVEDHPLDYATFEGVIPAPEYGAGTVLVWDLGRWEAIGDPRRDYAKGRLHFRLHGVRLHGEWALARMGGAAGAEEKENWLLLKVADEYSHRRPDPDEGEASVLTGRREEEIARGSGPPPAPGLLPAMIAPQLATLVDRPPGGDPWLHEIKYDGYRLLCRIEGGRARLLSRNGKEWTGRFGHLAEAAAALPLSEGWLDGEVSVLLPDGRSSFAALQAALSRGEGDAAVYYLFDLLHKDGADLSRLPLLARKEALSALLASAPPGSPLRYADHLGGEGGTVFDEACRLGLEGIVSKRGDRPHRPGRGNDWRKVKCLERQEFVIGGFSSPEGSRTGIGALLLGLYEAEGLRYVGRVGTGFSETTLRDLRARLDPLAVDRPPFANAVPRGRGVVTWVRPELVAEVAFANWTREGLLRQPSFQGLREDKPAREVRREEPRPVAAEAGMGERNGRVGVSRLSHPERVYYPVAGITKRDLARYYETVADLILPDLLERPLTLYRCPEGREGECFYQKHVTETLPPGIRAVPIETSKGLERFLAVESFDGLISLVQMGVLEIHTWGARRDRPDRPDRMVFDLDPEAGLPLERLIEAARALHRRLDALGLRSFLKTTGGKGLHIVVPLQRRHGWEEVKEFARAVARTVVHEGPSLYTINPAKAARRGKIYIDYLRNGLGASAIANYSTRAGPGAKVAVPLDWRELGTASDAFDTLNITSRLRQLRGRDPWADYAESAHTLTKRMKRALRLA